MIKTLFTTALLFILLSSNSNASTMLKLSCFFDGGGYDDEYISLNINPGGQTSNFNYESYRGELPGFRKISDRVFAHSLVEESIYTMVSFDKNFKTASLIVNYKKDGKEHWRQDFTCEYL